MTKTELIHKMDIAHENGIPTRLNRCSAWMYANEYSQAVALVSYKTPVAVYWRGTVWEFSRYSNTTTQHVRKFARLMDAPVVSLYRRSGMSKRDFEKHTACDWSEVIAAVLST